jgi:hypothetical protein
MAQKKRSNADKAMPISRGTETGAPVERPSIPDPLGDDRHVVGSGKLTSGGPGREGLLRAGATPLPDGGVKEHPTHDHGEGDDLGPDGFEEQFDEARNTGFEPRDEDEGETDETVESRKVPRRSAR